MAIRRNVLSLDAEERRELLAGLKKMKRDGTYDPYIHRHARATEWQSFQDGRLNAAHMGPAFLPWHRKFLLDFEADLQRAMGKPAFGLPYYDWTDGLGAGSAVWGDDLMGGRGNPVSGPFGPVSWPTRDAQNQPMGGLERVLGLDVEDKLPARADVHRLMYRTTYDAAPYSDNSRTGMRNALEGFLPFGLHNVVHVWIGGQMAEVPVAPNDPVFFLHHCNVDRVWAQWQAVHPGAVYEPQSGGPDGQNLQDPMFPWTTRPTDVLSISSLGYSYDAYYQIGTLQVIVTTGSNAFAGTDDQVQFILKSKAQPGPMWGADLDAAHCDHRDPFERGQTDTFTFKNVAEQTAGSLPLTPAVLQEFSLGKAPDESWFGRGDWTVAGLKIIADDLVLYDNPSLNQVLNNKHQHLADGHGNALNPNP